MCCTNRRMMFVKWGVIVARHCALNGYKRLKWASALHCPCLNYLFKLFYVLYCAYIETSNHKYPGYIKIGKLWSMPACSIKQSYGNWMANAFYISQEVVRLIILTSSPCSICLRTVVWRTYSWIGSTSSSQTSSQLCWKDLSRQLQ